MKWTCDWQPQVVRFPPFFAGMRPLVQIRRRSGTIDRMIIPRVLLPAFGALTLLACAASAAEPTAAQLEMFETKIRPLLAKHCYECHSAKSKKLQGELRLDSRAAMLAGGESGAAIVPGDPKKSLLIEAVRYEDVEMPPKTKLAAREITSLEAWIRVGAPWPAESVKPATTVSEKLDWKKLRGAHWAWQPMARRKVPAVRDRAWPRGPIDRFILAKLEAAGLKPAPAAEKRTLIRRAYFDLIGLPPTPEEVAAFVSDTSDEAFAKVVDRLLASRHYGERWGRHWLDVARYSDGFGGFSNNAALPHAWRYRDWVVEALNRNLPYDQFVKQQIAGDLMKTPGGHVATGLFALGPTYNSDGGDPDSVAQAKSETLDDRVDTLTRGFLGVTVLCARCHDHKFDPIPQQDYYSLAGVFNNSKNVQHRGASASMAHALADSGSGDMKVALRGNLRKQGDVAPRRFLRILAGENPPRFTKGSGRLELADAIVSRDNPLTARVIVNRIWMHHFGKAIVRSPSNFGTLGRKPTHPGLLDHLALTFIESGWSIKQLHRTVMLSSAYRMSSRKDTKGFEADGDNELVWRMNPRRLDAESWRDALLAVTGELDRSIGGAPVDNILASKRRTLYAKISRNGDRFESDRFLRLFDFPVPRASSAHRPTSIVPQQFLFMLNSTFMVERAKVLAERLKHEAPEEGARIARAYALLYGRAPSEAELKIGRAFVAETAGEKPKLSRWQQYAQVLLSSNELLYLR